MAFLAPFFVKIQALPIAILSIIWYTENTIPAERNEQQSRKQCAATLIVAELSSQVVSAKGGSQARLLETVWHKSSAHKVVGTLPARLYALFCWINFWVAIALWWSIAIKNLLFTQSPTAEVLCSFVIYCAYVTDMHNNYVVVKNKLRKREI